MHFLKHLLNLSGLLFYKILSACTVFTKYTCKIYYKQYNRSSTHFDEGKITKNCIILLFQTCMTCETRKKPFRKIFEKIFVIFVCLFLHTIKVNGDQCRFGLH